MAGGGRRASGAIAACTCTLAVSCAPSRAPTFVGEYAVLDATQRCLARAPESGSRTGRYGYEVMQIEGDDGGEHRFVSPSFECELSARVDGKTLRFDPQRCTRGTHEQGDIQGTARFDDDGVLQLRLTYEEIWPPSDEFWPTGIEWDCSDEYSLDPLH